MPRVLIADKLEPAGIELLQNAGIDVDNRPGLQGADLAAALRAADAVIARSQPKITAELLADPGRDDHPSAVSSHSFAELGIRLTGAAQSGCTAG